MKRYAVGGYLKTKIATRILWIIAASFLAICSEGLGQYSPGQRVWSPPPNGTFFSQQSGGTNFIPMPFLPFDPLLVPVYATSTSNWFIFDDSDVDYIQLNAIFSESVPSPPGDGGADSGGPAGASAYDYPPGSLWLEATGITNNQLYLTLHGTQQYKYYQLQSKTNLESPDWELGQVTNNEIGAANIALNPLPITNSIQRFFRAECSDALVFIYSQMDAIEPNPVSSLNGQTGYVQVARNARIQANIPVYYRISGTASNGVDYTNLTGVMTIPGGSTLQNIYVAPKSDYLLEGDETVTISLLPTNTYILDPAHTTATITIFDNLFVPVAQLSNPVGIDYHPPTQSLLLSYNSLANGVPYNFARIYTSAGGSNSVVTNWSGVHIVPDEVKVATVKTTGNGFIAGDMYFGNGTNIGWLSADGTVSNLIWTRLTNQTVVNQSAIRGGLYVDQSGSFGGDLIVVAGDTTASTNLKGVWRIDSTGHPTLLTNLDTKHLEGVITLTNDVQRWGPWAGKIITGDEDSHLIFTIDTNGVTTTYNPGSLIAGGMDVEDFDIIPQDQDLYCVDYHDFLNSTILKLPRMFLTNYVGDLLITQAGEVDGKPSTLFIVHWDNGFSVRSISMPSSFGGHFEHVTFAPIDLAPINP